MMGDKTIEEFIVLLRAGLWEEGYINLNPDVNLLSKQSNQGRANEKVDWEEVYQLAQEQSVQGLVLQGLEELRAKNLELRVPQMLLLQWIGEVQIIEQQNKEMNAFLAELIERLRKNDIYALLVKGQGVAQCYEKPLWRLSGDVDLFLSDSNYEKAKRLLLPLASEVETESVGSKHLGMTIDGFVVELHGTLRSGLSLRVEKGLDEIKKAVFFGAVPDVAQAVAGKINYLTVILDFVKRIFGGGSVEHVEILKVCRGNGVAQFEFLINDLESDIIGFALLCKEADLIGSLAAVGVDLIIAGLGAAGFIDADIAL